MNKPADSELTNMIFNSLQHLLKADPKAYRKRMATYVTSLILTDQIHKAPAGLIDTSNQRQN